VAELGESDVTDPDLPRALAKRFKAGSPFMRFLCEALDVPF
jgi:hypothetical protein